jgi:hypothetical protein
MHPTPLPFTKGVSPTAQACSTFLMDSPLRLKHGGVCERQSGCSGARWRSRPPLQRLVMGLRPPRCVGEYVDAVRQTVCMAR